MLSQDAGSEDDELFSASCQLVCEWAQKLLDQTFPSVRELAEHLVSHLYVNSKSVSAFTVVAGMQDSGIQNMKGNVLSQKLPILYHFHVTATTVMVTVQGQIRPSITLSQP